MINSVKQADAQIIHVSQNSSISTCVTATTYINNRGILDDLDVRASDLLQANGIIWVEGPSDRIYINRWIDLWSEGRLKEGAHYQVVFYGGRLLSHMSAQAPEDVDTGISILNANRNAILLIDSDKRNQQAPINETKLRIKMELEKIGALCWITKGKEIENYIPSSIVDNFFEVVNSLQVDRYGSFFDYLNNLVQGEGTKYSDKKPLLAEKLVPYMDKNNIQGILDLSEQMNEVCRRIDLWNK